MSPIQSWMEHSRFIPWLYSSVLTFNKICDHFCKGIHSFKYFFAIMILSLYLLLQHAGYLCQEYHLCNTTQLSVFVHHKWYSDHIERLACSALIHQRSPSGNELKGSFHTNCFFRIIIRAINCNEALIVCREICPNEINTRSLLIQICSASQQKTCRRLDREKARKFESIFPIRDADA